jgi:Tol biopolymer transport system component
LHNELRGHDTCAVKNRRRATTNTVCSEYCHPETNRQGSSKDLNLGTAQTVFANLLVSALGMLMFSSSLAAQRRPVLPQIDLPHSYYYRELYLPQLTSGPSSVAWAPDSKEVVYSMAGSLWRQKLDSREAVQLTDGAGYDYQPDWSPDGKSIIYVSYQKDAIELWLLDVASGKTAQLTSGGAVNVEPRWSPDGKRIIFVSTQFHKRFHIFRADVRDRKLENVVRLTGETKSDLPRYYYSQYDTEINPVWTRDGQEILFISNNGHIHGTGGFWRMKAEPGAKTKEIHYEETNWKARPDFSPDGSRMVYSSYLGGHWHNLWLMPANGGDAFPITYGGFDHTNVRWSPDGKRIAYISNSLGNTQLIVNTVPGGFSQTVSGHARYVRPTGFVKVSIEDENGRPAHARVSLTRPDGLTCVPIKSLIYTDDGFDRTERTFESHYAEVTFDAEFSAPAGTVQLDVTKGFEYQLESRRIEVRAGQYQSIVIRLRKLPLPFPTTQRWVSGDLHVHMNYGGTY